METIKVMTADNVRTELRDMLRVETKSRSIRKIQGDFYTRFQKVISDLRRQSDEALKNRDIQQYMIIKEQLSNTEMDFKAFFEKRFEKIAMLSLYDIDQDLLSRLTQEEKAAIAEYKSVSEKYSRILQEGEI
ncbi:MAG: hypothetical protein ACYCT2_04815 [Thermoplasmataceae archaeon]